MRAFSRSALMGVGAGVFLCLVGAFGAAAMPLVPRMALFVGIGLYSALVAATGVTFAGMIPGLASRPALRYAVICLMITPMLALGIWLAVSRVVLGRVELRLLVYFLPATLGMSAFMSLLSWAIFRPRQAPAAEASARPVRFLERLPVRLRGAEIYAVEAEDHYLRLHTSKGQDLILMRLSDAIAELEGIEGAQTHRSWWVAKDALADARRGDGRAVLKLKNGAEAPVSRTYAKALRDAGWY